MQQPTPLNEPVKLREQVEVARGPFSMRGTLTRPVRLSGVIIRTTPAPSLEGAPFLKTVLREGLGLLELHGAPRSDCPPSGDPALEEHDVHRHVQSLLAAIDWVSASPLAHMPVGIVASGSGATCALHAAAARPAAVKALALLEPWLALAAADMIARVAAPVLSMTSAENAMRLLPLREHLRPPLHEELTLPAPFDADDPEACERMAAWFRRWFTQN